MVTPAVKREAVAHLKAQFGLSERRACQIAGADRKMVRYRSQRARIRRCGDDCGILPMSDAGSATGGSRAAPARGGAVGDQPHLPALRQEGLTVRKRKARRKAVGTRAPILIEARANARWSLDFVHDQFACGRRFRVLNVVDDVTRNVCQQSPTRPFRAAAWRGS